jgi:protein-disulfide isomerase/uncharacterized membrane protein
MWERVKRILPVLVLAAIGLGVSIEIERLHRRLVSDGNFTSWCSLSAGVNCDVVLSSRYALLAGVSIALWAIGYYVALLGVAVAAATTRRTRWREPLANLAFVLSIWGVLFALYMAVIAFAVLHTVCLMCSALYLTNIALFVATWRLRTSARLASRRQTSAQNRLVLAGGIVAALGVLSIGGWEALGGAVHPIGAEEIAREHPEFVQWYFAQPVVSVATDGNHARGPADATVTIVEFSDFECGHCAAFHESVEDVLPRLGQSVRVVFRHFPLDAGCNPRVSAKIHPQACLAAVAAECAGEQQKFWQYHDVLFEHQQTLDRQFLIAYAERLGLDVKRFTACLGSAEARARVERDAAQGGTLGVDSTPTVFINGRMIKGALDAQKLADAVTLARANLKAP